MNRYNELQQRIETLRALIMCGYGRTNKPISVRRIKQMNRKLDEMEAAAEAWKRADRDGGVSMADYRTIAAEAIEKALEKDN